MKKRIGDVAKAAGVGVETVRFYQRAGVLDAPDKPARGWRTYGRNVEEQLQYVRAAREMGLTVADIAKLKRSAAAGRTGFCGDVREVVSQRLAAIEQEIAELERSRSQLADWLSACRARGETKDCPLFARWSAIAPPPKRKR